jgi:hypothetical protein
MYFEDMKEKLMGTFWEASSFYGLKSLENVSHAIKTSS